MLRDSLPHIKTNGEFEVCGANGEGNVETMATIELEGAFNFRDLGGMETRQGRRLRSGRLFRSDTLQALTDADAELLHDEIGLRGIVDLRLADELNSEGRGPLAHYPDIRYANVPLQMAATEGVPAEEVMKRLYESCLVPTASFVDAIAHLAQMSDAPVVFHCAAGKDRTGILTAIVLRLLDVKDDDIIADYMVTGQNMPRMVQRFANWPRYRDHMAKAPPQAYAVEAEALFYFLQHLDTRYGGARSWAIDLGLPAAVIDHLADVWLE